MKAWFDRARSMEKDPRVLQASNYPMQPWLDVAEGGWSTIVVTDNDRALAEKLADELSDLVWSLRDDFQIKDAVPIDDAVRMADAAKAGIVVLSDTGDTVFGGASGDSNLILELILRLGIESRALIPMISPEAVCNPCRGRGGCERDFAARRRAPRRHSSRRSRSPARYARSAAVSSRSLQPSELIDMGRTVVFEVGPVTMLISELRGIAGNVPDVYRALRHRAADYKMAVLKTASNFQYFAPLTSQLIRVDTRGTRPIGRFHLPWRRIPRPVYPLDPVEDWREVARADRPFQGKKNVA